VLGCWLGIEKGWNRPFFSMKNSIADYERSFPLVAKLAMTNLICFSGNEMELDDLVGLRKFCGKGIKKLMHS